MLDVLGAITLICGCLIIYHHLLFPRIMRWLGHRVPFKLVETRSRGFRSGIRDGELPAVTIIIPAYNEERLIAEKIRNLAILDYPSDKLLVWVVCDGSTDNTALVARAAFSEPLCTALKGNVIAFPRNRGKVAVLNEMIAAANTEIVALSDVSALVSYDALTLAASWFEHNGIGAVTGFYQLLSTDQQGEAAYWQYQTDLKLMENSLGSTLGVHGAFYAFRRRLFKPLPVDTINDDFVIPMQIIEQGYRVVYEPRISAIELDATAVQQDYQRRKRIAAGNLQQLLRLKHLLLPRFRGVAFGFASGKALRAIMPLVLGAFFFLSGFLSISQPLFMLLFVPQVLVYGLAALVSVGHGRRYGRVARTIHYIVMGYVASLVGTINYLTGQHRQPWRRVN